MDDERMVAEALAFVRGKEQEIMKSWLDEIGYVKTIGYSRSAYDQEITLIAEHPGQLIGKNGRNIAILKDMLHKEFTGEYSVKFVEVRGCFITPEMRGANHG